MRRLQSGAPQPSLVLLLALLVTGWACRAGIDDATHVVHDLVILDGTVMDPASGLTGRRHVGITDGVIVAVAEHPVHGRDTIDARGMVVAPGFIDLHQHAQDTAGYRVAALDGTTTALELESGTADVDRWYAERAGRAIINHGVSIGHELVRKRVMGDAGGGVESVPATHRAATPAELSELIDVMEQGFRRGAVAAGMLIEFTPGATPWEVLEVFRLAAKHDATVHVHLRAVAEPYYFLETEEIIAAAVATGASAHIVHLQSSLGEDVSRGLELIRGARARGLDLTTEVYPYTASMYEIESAANDDWRSWPDEKFARMEWPATGERLSRGSFSRYRAIGGLLVDHNNTEEVVSIAVADSLTMIASDGILEGGVGHPRVAGTFARVLGHYVRERRVLGLMQALAKITIQPARRLERRVPAMSRKGRVQVGADADLVIFDPGMIVDRATYRDPTRAPAGLRDVLVNGVLIVRNGTLQAGRFPGRAIRGPIQPSLTGGPD